MKPILEGIILYLCLTTVCVAGQATVIVRGQDFPPYHYLDEAGKATFLIS